MIKWKLQCKFVNVFKVCFHEVNKKISIFLSFVSLPRSSKVSLITFFRGTQQPITRKLCPESGQKEESFGSLFPAANEKRSLSDITNGRDEIVKSVSLRIKFH